MLQQGLQTLETQLNDYIKVSGCYFLDLLHWAELESNASLSLAQVEQIYQTATRDKKIMRQDCFIYSPTEIFNLASEALFSEIRAVGFRTSITNPEGTYIVALEKPKQTHFVLHCAKPENTTQGTYNDLPGYIWDSLDPFRVTTRGYRVAGYRNLMLK